MPSLTLSDNASPLVVADDALPGYLQAALEFAFQHLSAGFKDAAGKTISSLLPETFPLTLSASVPGSLAVGSVTLNVKAGASASLDLLTAGKCSGFLKVLHLDDTFAPALMSFAFNSSLNSGPSGTVGDFSFGLTSGQEITVTGYGPVALTDTFADGARSAIAALTLPHSINDLAALPAGHICRIEGKGSLKFTASVQYSILNNALAAAPLAFISSSISVVATSGPKLQVTAEHTDTHQLTIAACGNNKVRFGVSLSNESSIEGSLAVSIGVAANIGTQDALKFLIENTSPSPDHELAEIMAALGEERTNELTGQIKKVLHDAMQGGLTATVSDALKRSKDRTYLFLYEADLNALDAVSRAALQAALQGDFTQITSAAASLAGITELESSSTLTLTTTNTLTIHLLGILNFSDVHTFVQKYKTVASGGKDSIVLSATEIKTVENSIDTHHLREVLARSAVITAAAASAPQSPAAFTFQMVFFFEKATVDCSILQWISNVLTSISSPDAVKARSLLNGSPEAVQDVAVYLSLDLDANQSRSIFAGRTSDDFVLAGQAAMRSILADDPDSAGRLPLFSVDLPFWMKLRDAGNSQDILLLLKTVGITGQASVTDFYSIDWWAQAMGDVASALAKNQSVIHAEKSALKDSNGGFDIPWALLATRLLVTGAPAVTAELTYSTTQAFMAAAPGAN